MLLTDDTACPVGSLLLQQKIKNSLTKRLWIILSLTWHIGVVCCRGTQGSTYMPFCPSDETEVIQSLLDISALRKEAESQSGGLGEIAFTYKFSRTTCIPTVCDIKYSSNTNRAISLSHSHVPQS